MRINHKIILALLFISMAGICAGAFSEVYMPGNIKEPLSAMLEALFSASDPAASLLQSFFKSLKNNFIFIALTAVTPFIIITAPLLPLLIFIKGVTAGFSAAITLETCGIAGLSHVALYILPSLLIQVPAYCILASLAAETALTHGAYRFLPSDPALHRKRKALHYNARQYLFYYLIFTAVIILSCLLEAFLLQLKL